MRRASSAPSDHDGVGARFPDTELSVTVNAPRGQNSGPGLGCRGMGVRGHSHHRCNRCANCRLVAASMRALIEINLALDMLDEIADGFDLSFRNFNAGELIFDQYH
jgi:hypothetical protein